MRMRVGIGWRPRGSGGGFSRPTFECTSSTEHLVPSACRHLRFMRQAVNVPGCENPRRVEEGGRSCRRSVEYRMALSGKEVGWSVVP